MPPRPFPYPLGIGTDIVRIARIRDIIKNQNKPHSPATRLGQPLIRFLRKLLTAREQADFWLRFKNENRVLGHHCTRASEYLAGRWAAKEAIIKAAHHRKLTLLQVEIHRYQTVSDHSGGVYGLILDRPADKKDARIIQRIEVDRRGDTLMRLDLSRNKAKDGEGSSETRSVDQLYEEYVADEIPESASTEGGRFLPLITPYQELEGQIVKISISHDTDYATAMALAPTDEDV